MNPVTKKMAKLISQQKEELSESILSGDAKNYDEYRHDVGMLKGLELARLIILDVDKGGGEEDGEPTDTGHAAH